MLIEITNWYTGAVLFRVEIGNLKLAVEAAVASRADLGGADLGGAKAVDTMRLETGETLHEYRTIVVPALLAAGGHPVPDARADQRVADEWAALKAVKPEPWGRGEQSDRGRRKGRGPAFSMRKGIAASYAEAQSRRAAKSTPGAHHKTKTLERSAR